MVEEYGGGCHQGGCWRRFGDRGGPEEEEGGLGGGWRGDGEGRNARKAGCVA